MAKMAPRFGSIVTNQEEEGSEHSLGSADSREDPSAMVAVCWKVWGDKLLIEDS